MTAPPRASLEEMARQAYADSMWSSPDVSVCSCHCHGPSEANVEHHIAEIARLAHRWAAEVLEEGFSEAHALDDLTPLAWAKVIAKLLARERDGAKEKTP